MHKLVVILVGLLSALSLGAQAPVNDDCLGLIDLGFAPACPSDTFTNLGATPSNIGNDNAPTCFDNSVASRDVWFMFTCPDTLFEFRVTLTGVGISPIRNPQIAIYRGDCQFDGLAELLCKKAQPDDNQLFLDLTGLTPGAQYFIRVSDFSFSPSPNSGTFTLCVDKIPPINFINEGGSTLCEGVLYDTGGENGDYGTNENLAFVICPSDNPTCITFTLAYYNIEAGSFNIPGDALSFYDGNSTTAPLITALEGGGFGDQAPAGGGGVLFQVQASSGCLTVGFKSDDINQFEGWRGSWTCSNQPCAQPDNLAIDSTITEADIVNAVATPATTVTVTNINCPSGALGTFSFPTENNDLGLKRGLVLTSGLASNAAGPNNVTGGPFYNNFAPGDADLDFLSNDIAQESNDACVVEMDVFVYTNELSFEYIFGSEEYPEYVNSINDIFAFFVSGPGIAGNPGLTNGAKNIALLPGTSLPVEIETVNNLVNWEFYRNNEVGTTLQYDGLTSDAYGIKKSLTARTSVIPCNTYHLKLAVADRADNVYDSGVFVSEIQGSTPDLAVQFASGIDYFIENCSGTSDQLVVSLNEAVDQPTSFEVMVSGTATSGIDYTLSIPNVITFQPGETKLIFPIAPIPDGEVEGTETIVITLTNNFGCGSVTYKTLTIYLEDNVVVEVNGGDTLLICAGKPFQLQATGATEYFWSPPGLVSNPLISNPVVNPSNDGWVEVTGSISSCVDKDSVYLKIINPTVELVALSPTNICLGQSVTLEAINNTGGQGISWEPAALVNNPTAAITEVRPGQTTLIKVSVEVGGCLAFDTLTIRVDTLFFPDFISADTTICQNYAVQLATLLNSSTDYQWSPASGLSNDTISGPLATPEFSTTYVLTATSSQGYCSQQDSVTITVIPANIDISGVDYREICLGDTLDLQAVITPAGASVAWTPSFYLSSATGTQVKAFPDESVTIRARYKINGCDVVDSIKIRVDSLPYSIIQRVPDKSVYCPSDTIYLLTPAYEPSSFPDIDLFWPQSFSQQLTPPDKWNMVVAANKTDTLIRDITNRGCFVRDSIIIPVGIIPVFTFSVDPPTLCPGESAQITATVDPPDVIVEWDESPTLSCLKCLNPVANPAISTTYTLQAPEADCPSSASVTVPVLPIASIGLVPSQTICFGQSVVLNNLPAEPGVFYVWTSSPPGQPLDGAQPTVTPGQTTTYTLVADGPAVCPATASTTLTVEPQTFVAATFSPPTLCPGQSAQITAQVQPSGTAFEWVGAGLSCTDCLNPVATPTETTTYLLKSINTGCPAQTSITIPVLPVAQLLMTPSQSLCFGQSVLLNQAAEEPGVNYTWTSTPPGLPINGGQPTVIPDQTTTYTVVASGAGFCSNTGQVTITVVPQTYVNATYSPAQVCPGDLVQITAVVQPQGTPVEWSGVGLSCTNCLNPTLSPDATAVYLVKTTETICPAEANITIPVQPVAKLQVIDDVTICLGASVNLNLNPDEPGVDYTWTATPGGIFSIEAQPVVTPIATTTFSVNAQGNGICKNTDTVVVKVVNAMVDAGSNQSTCAGAMVTLGATTTGTIGGIFVWNPGNLSGSSPVVSPTVPTTYQVFYNYGPNNSCSATDTMRVSIAPSTEITDFVALPESGSTICLGAGVVIKASITPETATLLWKENGEIIDGVTTDSVRLVPVTEGPVNLRLVATNAFGCKDSADVSYITERCFEMPNVFTPSGDAVNDTFGPLFFGGTATVVKFQIFNRWGQMVFDGVEGQSTWDGRYEGKDAPSDVYVYKITVRFSNGEEELRGGQVTLLR